MIALQEEKQALEADIARLKREKLALASQLHLQEQVLHASLSGWMIWKVDSAALEVSFPWKKVLGDELGKETPGYDTLMGLLDPADRFSIRRMGWELLHGVAVQGQKLVYLDRNDGNRLPVLLKAATLPDENGQPQAIAYYVSVLQAEMPVAHALSGFNLDLLPLPLMRIRRYSGEPVFLNSLAWNVIEQQLGEAEIQHISELIGGDNWLLLQDKLEGGIAKTTVELSMKSKSDFLLFASVSGSFLDMLLVDVSKLQSSLSELEQINMQLDNFVYHASHDLRAPLRTVLGLLDVLRIEPKTEEREHFAALIEGSVRRLDSLVVDLLSISRNKRASDSLLKINFMVEVNQTVSSFFHLGETKNMEIRPMIKQVIPFVADITRVRIVLNNVISNAIKYRRYNIIPSFVEIRIHVEKEAAYIEIEDNGEGIPPDRLDDIFNMFYRATDTNEGSGLGLYIVRDVLQKLSGSIAVESTLGAGTKFSIMIPNHR